MDPNLPSRAYADGCAAGQRDMRGRATNVCDDEMTHYRKNGVLQAVMGASFCRRSIRALEIKDAPQ
jgi:hypothetical protein